MLIEQIIEFELRGPGPPGCTCTPTTGCFHDKTKKLFGKSLSGSLFTAKILQEAMYLTPLTWAKSLTKFNPKIQDFKRVLDLNFKRSIEH